MKITLPAWGRRSRQTSWIAQPQSHPYLNRRKTRKFEFILMWLLDSIMRDKEGPHYIKFISFVSFLQWINIFIYLFLYYLFDGYERDRRRDAGGQLSGKRAACDRTWAITWLRRTRAFAVHARIYNKKPKRIQIASPKIY